MAAGAQQEGAGSGAARAPDRIQSLERAMLALETIAEHGGVLGITAIAAHSGLAVPTTYRIVRTLVDLGYLRQEPSRQYALGPRLLLLAERSSSVLTTTARPHLTRLVDELGETANLAVLDGGEVAYVAQVPSRHAMRMFTEVGKRVSPHCTAVGKALLAAQPPEQVRVLLGRLGMPRLTEHTITEPDAYLEQLDAVRRDGWALDDGEQDIGVRCVAVRVPDPLPLALSISGPAVRMTTALVERAVPVLRDVAERLGRDLG